MITAPWILVLLVYAGPTTVTVTQFPMADETHCNDAKRIASAETGQKVVCLNTGLPLAPTSAK